MKRKQKGTADSNSFTSHCKCPCQHPRLFIVTAAEKVFHDLSLTSTTRTQGPGRYIKKNPCKSVGDLRDSSIRHTAPLCHCLIPTAALGCKAAAEEGLGIKLIILVICRVKEKKQTHCQQLGRKRRLEGLVHMTRRELLWITTRRVCFVLFFS